MKNKFIHFAFLVLTSSCLVNVAKATLISDLTEVDWQVAGDNLLTLDGSTGLEWLDITHTAGNSIVDTESEGFFGEFRWATQLEIEGLFDAVLIGDGYRYSTNATITSNAIRFQELFGVIDLYTQGVSRGSVNPAGNYGLGYVRLRDGVAAVNDPLVNCCWSETNNFHRLGSWLVRSQTASNTVPEPSTLAIFALGVIGLASRRFKK
ncbi:hypothetical protein NBRC116592_03030 [Colwellia sp. KU-HH00111]|uniref:PEP-CTERM sorting domain-containing protein n=1 Tax=Colwellia sp. KU-HH00111 TaxID=3127652 RepID=UPI003106D4D2